MLKLTTHRLILVLAHEVNFLKIKAFDERNINHLAQWENIKTEFSSESYLDNLAKWKQEFNEGRAIRFFLFLNDDTNQQIIGMCNFTNIIKGPFQACFLGYKIDHDYEGKGLMNEALQVSIKYMFEDLNLHRIMANYIPKNIRSAELLKRLGFIIEGHAKKYLLINGIWEDHIMTALINNNWKMTSS